MPRYIPAIPEPTEDPKALLQTVQVLKQAVELITRQVGPISASHPSWQDLVDAGVVDSEEVPKTRA